MQPISSPFGDAVEKKFPKKDTRFFFQWLDQAQKLGFLGYPQLKMGWESTHKTHTLFCSGYQMLFNGPCPQVNTPSIYERWGWVPTLTAKWGVPENCCFGLLQVVMLSWEYLGTPVGMEGKDYIIRELLPCRFQWYMHSLDHITPVKSYLLVKKSHEINLGLRRQKFCGGAATKVLWKSVAVF